MKEFFKRNKKVLLISLVIFLVFAIGAAVLAYSLIGEEYGAISGNLTQIAAEGGISNDTSIGLDTMEIFSHNLVTNLIIIVGGLFFSVISVLVLIFNAINIGAPFGSDLAFFIPSILPHGIPEYAASVFSLACAFNITKLEIKMIKNRSFRNTLKEHKRELKDILIMIAIVVILLGVAAIIEDNITEIITRWAFGL